MEPLPQELVDQINGLEKLGTRELRARYAELLADVPRCAIAGILRQLVAYRLQERHYGISLSDACRKWMEGEDADPRLGHRDKPIGSGARLIRFWKGVKHEVVVGDDGSYEYQGVVYKSLSAIARAITGTQWNGKVFFGVKK